MTEPVRVRQPRRKPARELRPFGRWFLTELGRRGWSQADYARYSGSHPRRISDWLYSAIPDIGSIQKIAETLSLPMETVVAHALDKDDVPASPLAEEIGQLARNVPHQLLVPIAVALRSLQDKKIQAAALRDLEGSA